MHKGYVGNGVLGIYLPGICSIAMRIDEFKVKIKTLKDSSSSSLLFVKPVSQIIKFLPSLTERPQGISILSNVVILQKIYCFATRQIGKGQYSWD